MLRFTFSIVLVLATDLSIKPVGWQLSVKNGTTINGVGIKPVLLWLKYQIVRLKYRIVRLKYQIAQDVKKGSNNTTSGYMSSERKSGQFVRIIAISTFVPSCQHNCGGVMIQAPNCWVMDDGIYQLLDYTFI